MPAHARPEDILACGSDSKLSKSVTVLSRKRSECQHSNHREFWEQAAGMLDDFITE